jgi:calpain-7
MSAPIKTLPQLKQDADRYIKRLPRASSKDEALEAAIKAAETSMQALKLATDSNEKSQLSSRVRQLLTQAENIKTSNDWRQAIQAPVPDSSTSSPTSSKIRTLKEPQSRRKLPTSEQVLLLKAGYLNGFKFPPWSAPPDPSEFDLNEGEELFLYVFSDPVSFQSCH